MRIYKSFAFNCIALCTVFIAVFGCRQADQEEVKQQTSDFEYLAGATLWVQHSAEYQALCLQAYAAAAQSLTLRCTSREEGDAPLAVVLDLDETVVDNSPYTAWQITNNQPFSDETWAQWTDLANAQAVPGAIDFLNLADSLGVAVFYISNRDTSALSSTQKNLQNLGIPRTDPSQFYLKTTTSDKTERRDAVRALGYDIALFIGDNLGDFDGKYDKAATDERTQHTLNDQALFGTKYIVLPNPVYGTWEGALYDYNRALNDDERAQRRAAQLNIAPIN